MPAKVCPRCGAQYANLKSTTCPECFAVLVPVDDTTAEELAAARAEVERSEEFQAAKVADDERFKELSFGACLTVIGITVLTLVLGIVFIVTAAHRRTSYVVKPPGVRGSRISPSSSFPSPSLSTVTGTPEPLTTLPVAAATLDEVLPPSLGSYLRLSRDQTTVLTGTLTSLFHGVYALPAGKPLDVYVLPAGRPTSEQNEYRMGLTVASEIGGVQRPLLFFVTEYWHFGVLAAPGDTTGPVEFRDALATHFRGR